MELRLSSLLLLLSLLFLIVCLSQFCKGTVPNSMSQETDQEQYEVEGGITFWSWKYTMKSIESELEGFQGAYPGISVNTVLLSHDDAYKKFLLANAANQGAPDVATLSGYYIGQYIETNALEDLTELIAPYRDRIVDSKWPDAIKDGRIYAMPWDSGPVALFYRRDVFEQAGFPSDPESVSELVSTWDKYVEVGKQIKARTGVAMHTMALDSAVGMTRILEHMMAQQGTLYVDNEGKIAINGPEALRALKLLIELKRENLLLDAEVGSEPWQQAMNEGKVATTLDPVWMGGTLRDIAKDSEGLWGVVKMPAWVEGGPRAAEGGGSYFGISKQSTNKEAAWAFIEYMLGNADTVNRIHRVADVFPSLKEAYENPMYDEPQPFFAGQVTGRLFVELSKESEPVYFSNDFKVAREIAVLEMYKAMKGYITPEAALREMERKMQEKTKREIRSKEGSWPHEDTQTMVDAQ
ncbi:ABC transporter substrate-binding protein [Paenibacillus senegalensis]|uniref:ABC transporter substrate-binding protein n=1 Tax=Paenibacillus senegalensis TaxID=1465766 RepID=UPI0002896FFD|nr:sugar ABC transporter substrate-binding protein [Paenibacillus senegalensis]